LYYRIGASVVSESPVSAARSTALIVPYYKWKVVINGGKTYWIGADDSPIIGGSFEVASKGGLGKASLNFSNMDIPVWHQENVEIYYNGEIKYYGFIDNIPDPEGGKISISPYSVRFPKTLYNYDYSSTFVSIEEIIEDIIGEKSTQLNLIFNPGFLDTGTTEVYNAKYDYIDVKKIFTDLVEQLDDRESGIDARGFYYIQKYSTNINHYIYYDDEPSFTMLTAKTNDSKIKNTRSQVYQRSTSGADQIRLGQVGYTAGEFAPLDIETITGIKENKIIAPQGLLSTTALNFAYKKLSANSFVPQNIKVKKHDLKRKNLNLFEKTRIWKQEALIWHTIIDCESLAGFTGGSLSGDSKIGSNSVTWSNNAIYWNSTEMKRFKGAKKIGFYLKGSQQGESIDFNVENVILGSTGSWSLGTWGIGSWGLSTSSTGVPIVLQDQYSIYIEKANSWQWVDLNLNTDRFTQLSWVTRSTYTYYIDEIQIKSIHRQYYDGNIIKIKYQLGTDLIDYELGRFEENLNDELFAIEDNMTSIKEVISST